MNNTTNQSITEKKSIVTATSTKRTEKPARKAKRQRWISHIKEFGVLYLLALPGIVALIAFSYVPMTGLIMVFKDYNFKGGIYRSPWADPLFKNFKFFFNNMHTALRATRNTVLFNLAFFIFGTIFAVFLAIMLYEIPSRRFVKINQSVMFFPYFISWMVTGSILQAFISNETGMFARWIERITGNSFNFYATPWVWVPLLIFIHVWQSAGYTSIIYYASLSSFDTAMYEAAEVDGATKLQQIFKITLPLLRPTITIMFLLSIGNMLKGGLDMVMGLTNLNPLLFPVTDWIDVFVYRSGVQSGEMAFASAVSLYQSVFGLLLVLISNTLAKWYDPDTTLF